MEDYDALVKIVVVGDKSVGKSSLVLRFCEDHFHSQYIATIGVDFRIRTMDIDGRRVKLQVWDTAGEERFKAITKSYYRGAHGALIVYDCTDRHTFDSARYWLEEVQPAALPGAAMCLVGSKSDLYAEGQGVERAAAQQWAVHHRLEWFEASAKTNSNVDAVFASVARHCLSSESLRKAGAAKAVVAAKTTAVVPTPEKDQGCAC